MDNEFLSLARVAFALEVSAIDRDARPSELTADELAKLSIFLLAAPKWARQAFLIEYADDRAVTFTDEKIILKAIKR